MSGARLHPPLARVVVPGSASWPVPVPGSASWLVLVLVPVLVPVPGSAS